MVAGRRASVFAMSRAILSAILVLAAVSWEQGPARAQTTSPVVESTPSSSSSAVGGAPYQTTPSRDVWLQRDLEDAEQRSRRSRNALIGTSASFALGVILAGVGSSQCQVTSLPGQNDELVCNNAGNVLLPLGGTLAGLSAIGMITSGIILGVANKRKREIQRDIRRSHYGSRPRWDVRSGGLVF